MRLPAVIAHADWSTTPKKRWLAVATRTAGDGHGGYCVMPPRPVGPLDGLAASLTSLGRPVLLGVDFPLGLPRLYEALGVMRFLDVLPLLGREPPWERFFEPCADPSEISLTRPFYPRGTVAKGTPARRQLIEGLGVESYADLHRTCDLGTGNRPAGSTLFLTLGAQQVGKAAITAWRNWLQPALASGQVGLWPFHGPLAALLERYPLVVAETYPVEMGLRVGITPRIAKRTQAGRAAVGGTILDAIHSHAGIVGRDLSRSLLDGWGPGPDAEDPFDCVLGLAGMLRLLVGAGDPCDPPPGPLRDLEGWILGQPLPAEGPPNMVNPA